MEKRQNTENTGKTELTENTGKQYRFDITAIGEVLIDFTWEGADEGSRYPVLKAHPGGAPANFLAAAAVLGARTAFIGKVGNDAFGKLLVETLKEHGINTDCVYVTDEAFTTMAFVTLDEHGDREFSFARKPGADTLLAAEDVPYDVIAGSKILHYGSLLMTGRTGYEATMTAISCAKDAGTVCSYDPNYRKPLWKSEDEAVKMMLEGFGKADVVKISDEEAELLFGLTGDEALRYMTSRFGTRLVMLTKGPKGADIMHDGKIVSVKAPAVKPVDTTGAGDICGGSLAAGLLALPGFTPRDFLSGRRVLTEEELLKIGKYAVYAASRSTEKPGGITSIERVTVD